MKPLKFWKDAKSARVTEQNPILYRRLECISWDLELLWIAWKVFSTYLEGNRRWVPLFYSTYSTSVHLMVHVDSQ